MNYQRSRLSFAPVFILLIVFAFGVLAERAGLIPGHAGSQPEAVRGTFKPFWEAWELVQRYFVDREKVKDQRMMQGALAGMVNSLGDTGHTTYLTKEQREEMTEGLSGHFEGIGARISIVRARVNYGQRMSRSASGFRWRSERMVPAAIIVQVMPRSPARAAGIRAGDVVLAVDGQPMRGRRLTQIVAKVRGKPGTTIRMRLGRPGRSNPIDVEVKRARVLVDEVSWQMLPGRMPVAHICLLRFSKNCGEQLHAALEQAKGKGARGVILDLRGNPGGLKEQAVVVAGEFLPKDAVVFLQQDAQGAREQVRAAGDESRYNRPLVVLIDGGSASSSEIVAGALQDNDRAKLVGTRTVGTGTVLREFPLSDGSAVLLAVSLWLTPNGREIWHKGITPDVIVSLPVGATILLPDDQTPLTAKRFAASDDLQLIKAHDLLLRQMR